MNIFEHLRLLGLTVETREGNKITQHVKHISEVPENKITYPMRVQIKKDGIYCMMVKSEHGTEFFSRTGMALSNMQCLMEKMNDPTHLRMQPGVYIAELCNKECSLEVLSGIINPNRNKELSHAQAKLLPSMKLHFHDYLFLYEFCKGVSLRPYSTRHSYMMDKIPYDLDFIPVEWVISKDDALLFAERRIYDGEEGVVFKQDHGWVAGHKGYRMMKLVRGIDYDLLCIGCEEGKGKYKGKIANLIFKWKDGETIKCMLGKGWTHDMAEAMYNSLKFENLNSFKEHYPIGKIFQVYALQESSKGKLRLPKVGELRHDKTTPDVI